MFYFPSAMDTGAIYKCLLNTVLNSTYKFSICIFHNEIYLLVLSDSDVDSMCLYVFSGEKFHNIMA